jgi:uncharacterized protein with HEPN domain
MRPEDRDSGYLWDILEAARLVRKFTQQKKLNEYLADKMLQAAVERKIEIIGEAARKISDEFKQEHPNIPWKSIIAQRNVMIHDYGQIKQDRVWAVAVKHIPDLITQIEPLLPPLPPELNL